MRRGLILWFLCSDFPASVFADIYLQIIYTDWNYLIFFSTNIVSVEGFRGGSDGICLQYRWAGFDPWVGKIPWRRAWQPTPVFFPGESHGQRSLAGYSPQDHRIRHDWVTELNSEHEPLENSFLFCYGTLGLRPIGIQSQAFWGLIPQGEAPGLWVPSWWWVAMPGWGLWWHCVSAFPSLFVFASLHSLWDLSPPTKDWTQGPGSGSTKS